MRSQIFAERQIQYFLNYHVFYFILFYLILYCFIIFCLFIYLFIYLFYLKLTTEKNLPSPSPTGVSPFATSFANCDLPGESRVFSIVSIIAALKLLREVTACICKGDEQPKKGSGHSFLKNWNSLRD